MTGRHRKEPGKASGAEGTGTEQGIREHDGPEAPTAAEVQDSASGPGAAPKPD